MDKDDILDTMQITKNLSSHPATCRYFEGVFALDQLPQQYLSRRPALIVCNTAYSGSPGEHWIGFYAGENDVEYFDSYGCPPSNKAFADFIAINGGSGKLYNTRCLQSMTAATCGKYVMTYLLYRALGLSIDLYLKEFKEGGDSDEMVRLLYKDLFRGALRCLGGQICRSWKL